MFGDGIGWVWLLNWLIMIIFWGGIFALVIWVIVKLARGGSSITRTGSALDIAKDRYARGEISREEFMQMKKDID
jgi:putative membrane protein